jgi:hypothetical protein
LGQAPRVGVEMHFERYPNRWMIAAAAAAVMLTIGTVYSWATFTQPLLVAYRWDLTTTTWVYAIANFSLAAVGAVIVLSASVILPYLTKKPASHPGSTAKTTRPSTFPVPFPRTVPVGNFAKP